jgi:hypothetical protein
VLCASFAVEGSPGVNCLSACVSLNHERLQLENFDLFQCYYSWLPVRFRDSVQNDRNSPISVRTETKLNRPKNLIKIEFLLHDYGPYISTYSSKYKNINKP